MRLLGWLGGVFSLGTLWMLRKFGLRRTAWYLREGWIRGWANAEESRRWLICLKYVEDHKNAGNPSAE